MRPRANQLVAPMPRMVSNYSSILHSQDSQIKTWGHPSIFRPRTYFQFDISKKSTKMPFWDSILIKSTLSQSTIQFTSGPTEISASEYSVSLEKLQTSKKKLENHHTYTSIINAHGTEVAHMCYQQGFNIQGT